MTCSPPGLLPRRFSKLHYWQEPHSNCMCSLRSNSNDEHYYYSISGCNLEKNNQGKRAMTTPYTFLSGRAHTQHIEQAVESRQRAGRKHMRESTGSSGQLLRFWTAIVDVKPASCQYETFKDI